jgi:hypothetical protein
LACNEITVPQAAKLLGCSLPQAHVLIDEGKLPLADKNARLARSYAQQRNTKDGKRSVISRGVRRGFTLLRSEVLEAKAAGVWPPRSPNLDPARWKDKSAIAKDRGIKGTGKPRNALSQRMNQLREQYSALAEVIWLPNAKGRLHPRTKWDTEKLYPLLDGKAPSAAANAQRGPAAAPETPSAGDAQKAKTKPGPKPNKAVQRVYHVCHEVYFGAKEKRGAQLREVQKRLGKNRVKTVATMAGYADRHDPEICPVCNPSS